MPLKKLVIAALTAATALMAAVDKTQPTPYDLIRPVWPLTWDESVFDRYDTTVTMKHNMVPRNRKPAAFAPNEFIPDTLNQAYLDAMNVRMSPIRINQAGYMESDPDRQFYYVGAATTFEVVDQDGKSLSPKVTGTFTPSGKSISSDWTIIAGTNAATNDQKRYQVDITGQSGMVQVGHVPTNVPTETRLRIKVGNEISSTFVISDRVYSMVRAAALKFYGINRSGNGDSWFHKPSHTKDGAGPVVTGAEDVRDFKQYNAALEGTLEGGYYDCGDHLKESQTQMYAFMVAAVMAATNPDGDEDVYAFNQSETQNTDGIPDMLREAKHGADFVLRAYNRAKGVIDDMALSVGNFGSDHGWWGRPENQDLLPINGTAAATDRGGPVSRTVRLGEVGSNIGGETAAGLAILAKDYAIYDKPFADSCLMVAEKMYDFAKSLAQGKSSYDGGKPFVHNTEAAGWSTPAYNGNNEFYDDLALASVALLYATGKKEYADDMIRTRNLVAGQEYMENCAGCFEGGWFVTNDKGFLKNGKNTSWANAYAYATYALYKLILQDKNKALTEYGLTEDEWLHAIEDCIMSMIYNLGDISAGSATIELPSSPDWKGIGWKQTTVKYDPLWFSMFTDGTWIYNRYQAGNIFEVLAYADVAKDITDKGIVLPDMGAPNWKADEMHQLGINQLNYLLGMNPWDVSYILGIGDKNDAHPHHRAANPEGKNTPGAGYKYNPPVGALFGGVRPDVPNNVIVPSNKSWEDYFLSETCIDAAATLVSSGAVAAAKFDRTKPPKVSVEIRHVSMDSAIVMVKLTNRGFAQLSYGTNEAQMTTVAQPDSNKAGMQHEIILRGLEKGTTYYFYAVGTNAYAADSITVKYMVDSTQTPFSFTTLNTVESAQINNITVCNLFGDTAEVMWYTPNGEYESKIYWDTVPHATASDYAFNSGNGNADVSGIPTKFHYVKIGGLKEKTTYYYMVESNGVQQNVDDKGNMLKFTTPVGWYDFSVRTYQYEFTDLDFMAINLVNNEARAFDSLNLHLYITAKPEDVEKCATLVDADICQAYDEAGFNKVCETNRELRDLLRGNPPVRLDDTYKPSDGTYTYYFDIPLGSTTIKSSSRMRLDVGFSKGISNDGFKTCDSRCGTAIKRMTKNTGDWSWRPHTFQEDGADYDGMPFEDKDYGDLDGEVPVNPYITVYRKGEFISGYSPSAQEMSHKKAHYEMEVTYDAPFNVSDGSYVQIDQTSSTVWVTGHAYISEGGFITKIWANGQLVDAQPAFLDMGKGRERYLVSSNGDIIGHYNSADEGNDQDSLGLWTLNIPVKMGIGSNKIDITLFAGADPECQECTENGGCAFVNRTYYVQFTRGNLTASALTIKDLQGNAISSPADPKNTSFYIYLNDKDKANHKGDLNVKVINGKKQDTLLVKMVEDAANPGSFKSASLISAVAIAKNIRNNTQISFFAGDTIQVIYLDPDDEEDVSKQIFFAEATMPMPQKILAQDTDCDNIADKLFVQFSNALSANYSFDSIRVYIDGMKDTVTLAVDPASAAEQSDVLIDLPIALGIPENASPMGKATIYMKAEGVVQSENFDIRDGIAPRLQSVTLLENPDHAAEYDTVMISFTEPVQPFKAWPLTVYDINGAGIPQESIQVIGTPTTDNDGKSYMFAIAGNDKGKILPVGAMASINVGVQIADNNFNLLDPIVICKQVYIAETPKPVPVTLAEMRDNEGDGYPDEVYLRFEKKLRNKDVLDSFVVEWGLKSEIRSFITKADTTSGEIVPVDNSWSIRDSVGEPYEIMIDSVKSMKTDTFSIVTIKIPTTNSYSKGATTGPYEDSNGIRTGRVTPRLGPEGGFFDKSYSVADKCPPIIVSTSWRTFDINGKQMDALEVTVSEPLDTIGQNTDYFERLREGFAGTYYSPKTNIELDAYKSSSRSYTLNYPHDSPNAFWLTDSIRLVPNAERAYFKDKAGLIAGPGTPWVPIVGRITKAKFKIEMVEPITNGKNDVFYGGLPLPPNENFRLSLKNKDNATLVVAAGAHKLKNVSSFPIQNYLHAGPVFKIEVIMPDVLDSTQLGEAKRTYEISLAVDLYSNTGSYVNSTTYKFNPLEYVDYISPANSSLTFYLEWCAPNDYPLSAEGKKIATGPYIAKFTTKAKGKYTAARPDTDDNTKSINANETLTKTFGFRRVKK